MSASVFFLILAVVVFLVAALLAFGVVTGGASVIGLVALGSAFFAAAHLPV